MAYDVGYRKPPYSPETQFKPGQSGNPGGKPKSLTRILQDLLNDNSESEKHEVVKETLALAKSRGKKGQVPALEMIWDRIDGKLIERHLNLTVTTTPELLEHARSQLLEDKSSERALLVEYGEGDG